jgi:putative sterol carrier protein
MFPFEIPPGTTLRSLVTKVFPETHAKLVPAAAGADAFTIVLALEGLEGGGSFTADVKGGTVTVREEEARQRHVWVCARAEDAERFLGDWSGAKRFVPKFVPGGDLVLMSDPRILKRLAMVSGKIELALTDFEGERVAMTVALGAAAKKTIDPEGADVTVEATVAVFEELLAGTIAPEDAIAEGRVTVKGNKLLAMQLALAVAPLAPAKKANRK